VVVLVVEVLVPGWCTFWRDCSCSMPHSAGGAAVVLVLVPVTCCAAARARPLHILADACAAAALALLLILLMLTSHLLPLTLSLQVADRAFSSPHDFRENLGLIWHNAVLYNGPDHLVAKHANELKVGRAGQGRACGNVSCRRVELLTAVCRLGHAVRNTGCSMQPE
jgi:hypothetical protein